MSWWPVIPLSLDQLLTFHPLCFQCHEMSWRVPLMWRFLLVPLPLGHCHSFHHESLHLYRFVSPSLISCHCRSRLCQTVVSAFLWSATSFYKSLYIRLLLSVLFLISLVHVHLCGPAPSDGHLFFVKWHMGLFLRDEEATPPNTLFSVWELNSRWPHAPAPIDFENNNGIGH